MKKNESMVTKAASGARFEGRKGSIIHTHEVTGSSPVPPTRPHPERVLELQAGPGRPGKAGHLSARLGTASLERDFGASSIGVGEAALLMAVGGVMLLLDAIRSFVNSRQLGGCTRNTLAIYEGNLCRFADTAPEDLAACTTAVITVHLASLQARLKPISVHQHLRTLRTFFRWCVDTEIIQKSPMAGVPRMRVPKALPKVPEAEDVRKLLDACSGTFAGRRNRALLALLVDSGLRISEALALRVSNLNFQDGTISIRNGKGQKDGVGFFGADASRHVRSWLKGRIDLHPDDLLFCTKDGGPLTRQIAARTIYRLSEKAGLRKKIGPHALRHFAATSILRQTGDLELVRKVLRHESLTMTLRYAQLTGTDVSTKFRRASPLADLARV